MNLLAPMYEKMNNMGISLDALTITSAVLLIILSIAVFLYICLKQESNNLFTITIISLTGLNGIITCLQNGYQKYLNLDAQKSPFFDTLTKMNVSLILWIIMLTIAISAFSICIMYLYLYILDLIKNKKIYNILYNMATPIVIIIIIAALASTIYGYDEYKNYLTSQLTKKSYIVTQISYDKKTLITDKGKKLKNISTTTTTVEEPTTDKSKIGKVYYTLETCEPNKIKDLININKKSYNLDNKLVKHIYVKKYEKLN